MTQARNIINALVSGDKVQATTVANNLIQQRSVAQMDNVKLDVAKSVWDTPAQAQPSNTQGE
jgi:hypothetical protein